ncbi:MAG: hypothetical protein J2P48_06755 [Alphaproteobacteria bacterium]|nr:hypothetical protein [Alphaproteobacteria bacterium]
MPEQWDAMCGSARQPMQLDVGRILDEGLGILIVEGTPVACSCRRTGRDADR